MDLGLVVTPDYVWTSYWTGLVIKYGPRTGGDPSCLYTGILLV